MHICTSSNANNATAQQGHEKSERRLAERCASASVIKSLSISIVVVQRRESRYGLIRLGSVSWMQLENMKGFRLENTKEEDGGGRMQNEDEQGKRLNGSADRHLDGRHARLSM